MPRVLIADDHSIVRRGLRAIISAESSLQLVGETTSGRETIGRALADRPDVLILDLSMPDLDGIAVIEAVKARIPQMKILILTVHEDQGLLRAALQAGASGYVLKRAAESELVAAIRSVLHDEVYVDPSMVPTLLSDPQPGDRRDAPAVEALTEREDEILTYIADGYTNRQIGDLLRISVRTVETHRASISSKLGLRGRADLVRFARRRNLAH
jgi:two-component system, NarL family, response regulator NreC